MLKENLDEFIDFVFTKDGSVGLYNHAVGDIYHSSHGAASEAVEKFIKPLNFQKNFSKKNNLKILDICFGIGYNTKAFLNLILKNNYPGQITIDALEYDKKLVLLSPFIKDYIFGSDVSFILLNSLKNEILMNRDYIQSILCKKKNKPFFSYGILNLIEKFNYFRGNYDPLGRFDSFLHNIYYRYVSTRNKKRLIPSRIKKILFNPYYLDARESIQTLTGGYDIVFLDAFTPAKLPTLWSYEFFLKLYELMNDESILVTYSNSSAVKNAMCKAGFYTGKIFDKRNRPCGTICSKNINFIEYPLDEFDLGLMNTNAGVCFFDPGLNNSSSVIIEERNKLKRKLNLESSSGYLKRIKEDGVCTT